VIPATVDDLIASLLVKHSPPALFDEIFFSIQVFHLSVAQQRCGLQLTMNMWASVGWRR
jgi:hypothetical protein